MFDLKHRAETLPHTKCKPMAILAIWAILVIVIVGTRIPTILHILHGIVLNPDELEMTLSSVDRFLGVPAVNLAWPGGPQQFLGVLAIICKFALVMETSQEAFVQFLSNVYRNPWPTLTCMRVLVALISSIGLASLFFPIYRATRSVLLSAVCVLEFALIPQIWIHSQMANADAMALGLACLAFSVIGYTPYWPPLMGILLGLACAQKISVVFAVPFILAMAINLEKSLKPIVCCIGFMMIGFILACPYLWVDPVRLGKAILGNAAGRVHSASVLVVLKGLSATVTPLLLCSAIFGLGFLIWSRQIIVPIALIVSFTAALSVIAKADVIYSRYFLWSTIPLVFMLGLFLNCGTNWVANLRGPYQRLVGKCCIGVFVAIMLSSNVIGCLQNLNYIIDVRTRVNNVVGLIVENAGATPILIPRYFVPYLANQWSRDAIEAQWQKTRRAYLSGRAILEFATRRGITTGSVKTLVNNFTEREQVELARMKTMAYCAPSTGLNCQFWENDETANRYGCMTKQEATTEWREGKAALVLFSSPPKRAPAMDVLLEYDYLPKASYDKKPFH